MKHHKGFTLIEVVAAISILTIGALGAFALIQRILAFSKTSSYRLTATYLAQEGLETIRSIRDSNWLEQRNNPALAWDSGISAVSSYNLDYQRSSFPDFSCSGDYLKFNGAYYNCWPSSESNVQTNFQREITVSKPASDRLVVSVKVFFTDPRGTQLVQAEAELYDWK